MACLRQVLGQVKDKSNSRKTSQKRKPRDIPRQVKVRKRQVNSTCIGSAAGNPETTPRDKSLRQVETIPKDSFEFNWRQLRSNGHTALEHSIQRSSGNCKALPYPYPGAPARAGGSLRPTGLEVLWRVVRKAMRLKCGAVEVVMKSGEAGKMP